MSTYKFFIDNVYKTTVNIWFCNSHKQWLNISNVIVSHETGHILSKNVIDVKCYGRVCVSNTFTILFYWVFKFNYRIILSHCKVFLSVSLCYPATAIAGVIGLDSDSTWQFAHACPCRPTTQRQEWAPLMRVTVLPPASIRTHTPAATYHKQTHKHMSELLNP